MSITKLTKNLLFLKKTFPRSYTHEAILYLEEVRQYGFTQGERYLLNLFGCLYLDSLETVEECWALLKTEDDSYKKSVEEYWNFKFEC